MDKDKTRIIKNEIDKYILRIFDFIKSKLMKKVIIVIKR